MCHDHVHVSIATQMQDGTIGTFHSPGLPRDRETIEMYLEYIAVLTDKPIRFDKDFTARDSFPSDIPLLEEPLELDDEED
jgi:hypothetical protein